MSTIPFLITLILYISEVHTFLCTHCTEMQDQSILERIKGKLNLKQYLAVLFVAFLLRLLVGVHHESRIPFISHMFEKVTKSFGSLPSSC